MLCAENNLATLAFDIMPVLRQWSSSGERPSRIFLSGHRKDSGQCRRD